MTDQQPYPLELAAALDANADLDAAEGGNPAVCKLERDAASLLRTQHAAIERKDALLMQALLLCDWLAETSHQRGSINGLAAQLRHAITLEIEQ